MNATSVGQALGSLASAYTIPWTQTLLHFLWEGCLVALGYALLARLLRPASANARYVAGVLALLTMGACLPGTFLLLPVPAETSRPAAPFREPAVLPNSGEVPVVLPAESCTTASEPPATSVVARQPIAASHATWGLHLKVLLPSVAPWATSFYLGGVLLMLLRVGLGLQASRRLRAACVPVTERSLLERLESHARRLGLRAVPVVAYCQRVSVPVVVGLLRPMILLPASLATGLTPRQLEAVLVHELAHVRRFDLAIQVAQRLLEAVLFFHPAVWWLSRRISLERENACDDLALHAECNRLEYAEALVRLAEQCLALQRHPSAPAASVAATGRDASHFKQRVLRLLGRHEPPSVRLTTGGVLVAVALLLAVLLGPIAWRNGVLQTAQAAPLSTQQQEAALQILRTGDVARQEVANFSAIRDLIQTGKPAVPNLCDELDRTEADSTFRALAIALREIGDPRAVPALIRAIPRTLMSSSGDGSLRIKDDTELQRFMEKHANGRGGTFEYRRPFLETMSALQKLTGHSDDWNDLRFVFLEGSPEQQRLQRQLFVTLAQGWSKWWTERWHDFLPTEEEAQLDRIQKVLAQAAQAVASPAPTALPAVFPHGPRLAIIDAWTHWLIRSFVEAPTEGFWDLDTGRFPEPPAELVKMSTPDRPSAELLAWAEREGVDLILLRFTPPESDKPIGAAWPVGLKVWQVDNALYKDLPKSLQGEQAPDLSRPWEGPLAQRDEKTKAYDEKATVSFLFRTREGTCGALQLKAPLLQEHAGYNDGGLEYKFLYEGPAEK